MGSTTPEVVTPQFTQYRRKQIAELRPYQPGEDLAGVSISAEDAKAGSPKEGDMIARNPKNHADQWLVARQYFEDNFELYASEPHTVSLDPPTPENDPVGRFRQPPDQSTE